ncbi:MAG TPA: signal peptidase II [Anaerolineae bacterium]|nr:signal peptidase II [Anaerolineae bacterium]
MKISTRSKLLLVGAAALVFALDQASKFWVVRTLPPYTPVDVFPWLKPILSFTYITNMGVAFGLFPQLSTLLKFLPLLVIGLIVLFRRSIVVTRIWLDLALGIVVGGALGNLWDRLFRGGAVVDFLDVNFWPFRQWPVFNLADASILVGVGILLLDSLLFDMQPAPIADVPTAPEAAFAPEDEGAHV